MKKLVLLFALALMQTALFAQTTWTNDKMHSQAKFTITHLGVSDVSGLFKDFDAKITTSKADFSDAKFELTAKTASVWTGVDMRDQHLQSADFFDVANFPQLTFTSTSVKSAGAGKFKVTGNLTIHGVTKPVTLDLWYRGTITNPMSKADDAGFQVSGVIKRSDFNFGSKFPAPMLSDDVTIKVDGEFAKAQ